MTMQLREAKEHKVNIVLGTPAGTDEEQIYTALRMASALAGGDMRKVAFIDASSTSVGTSGRAGQFQVLEIGAPVTFGLYCEAIEACAVPGVEVIVVDFALDSSEQNVGGQAVSGFIDAFDRHAIIVPIKRLEDAIAQAEPSEQAENVKTPDEAPGQEIDVDNLKQQILDASTPDELNDLSDMVNELEPGPRKSLRITVTTKAKNMSWVTNGETKRFELPQAAQPEEPSAAEAPASPEPAKTITNEEPYGYREPEEFIKKEPTESEKPLFDQIITAPDVDALHLLFTENTHQINASNPLSFAFKKRLEQLTQTVVSEAFAAAKDRREIFEVYQKFMREIQASSVLTDLYTTIRERLPEPLNDLEPHPRDLKWFQARVGKTVQMHGADQTKYTGPYEIEGDWYPAEMIKMQEAEGFTFSDIPTPYTGLEGTKLD